MMPSTYLCQVYGSWLLCQGPPVGAKEQPILPNSSLLGQVPSLSCCHHNRSPDSTSHVDGMALQPLVCIFRVESVPHVVCPCPGRCRSPSQEKIRPGLVDPLGEETLGSGPVWVSSSCPAPSCPVGLGGCGASLAAGELRPESRVREGRKCSPCSLPAWG